MGEADRLARARRDQAEREKRKRDADEAAIAKRADAEALQAIKRLVPQVLAALAKQGYPNATLLRVKSPAGSSERAAWQVASSQDWVRDGYLPNYCYLLSTGNFAYENHWTPARGSTPCRASKVFGHTPQAIEEGLRELLKKYSA